jgi:hypothetical protein
MFFVSEEFLRKYEAGEAFGSTLDQVTKPGESLFPEAHGEGAEKKRKAERAEEARRRGQIQAEG